jgi:hypothetical protein
MLHTFDNVNWRTVHNLPNMLRVIKHNSCLLNLYVFIFATCPFPGVAVCRCMRGQAQPPVSLQVQLGPEERLGLLGADEGQVSSALLTPRLGSPERPPHSNKVVARAVKGLTGFGADSRPQTSVSPGGNYTTREGGQEKTQEPHLIHVLTAVELFPLTTTVVIVPPNDEFVHRK